MTSVETLLVRKRVIVVASLSLIIFSATISVLLGIGAAPGTVIGNSDVYVITSKATDSLLNSRLDVGLNTLLLENGFVTNSSPEIFAFAEIRDSAVIVRGVDFQAFMGVEGARLVSGSMPSDPSQGLIGLRLADRIHAEVGDRYPLVGSFGPSVSEVEIAGIIASSSGIEDELIVSLPLSRCLTGIATDSVSIIRVLGDTTELEKMFGQGVPRFSIYDLAVANRILGVGRPTEVSLQLKNWGDANGTAHVTITDMPDNITIIDSDYFMNSSTTIALTANYSFSSIGNHSVRASISGAFPQNISTNVTVKGPFLSLVAPDKMPQFHNFTISVINQTLEAVAGATVSIGGFDFVTNTSGGCLINASLVPGFYTINASSSGYESALGHIEIINSSSLPSTATIRVFDIILTPDVVKVGETCTIALYVQNFGNLTGSSQVSSYIGSARLTQKTVTLSPLETTVLFYNFSFQSAGEKTITSGQISATLTVESHFELNPALIRLLVLYGDSSTLDPSRAELIYDTAKISEANILIVLVSLAVLSGMLVTLGVSISFMREINDNLRIIGILRSLGASSRQLLWIMFKGAFLISLPAAAIGIVGGVVLAFLISNTGNLIAFGQFIQPVINPSFLIVATAGSIAICVGSSLIASLSVSRKRSIRMIRGLKEDAVTQVNLKELLGDE
jgi:ABC-type antimicrobial peptide transport system permease subunit